MSYNINDEDSKLFYGTKRDDIENQKTYINFTNKFIYEEYHIYNLISNTPFKQDKMFSLVNNDINNGIQIDIYHHIFVTVYSIVKKEQINSTNVEIIKRVLLFIDDTIKKLKKTLVYYDFIQNRNNQHIINKQIEHMLLIANNPIDIKMKVKWIIFVKYLFDLYL